VFRRPSSRVLGCGEGMMIGFDESRWSGGRPALAPHVCHTTPHHTSATSTMSSDPTVTSHPRSTLDAGELSEMHGTHMVSKPPSPAS
jgi:hypothetical protein